MVSKPAIVGVLGGVAILTALGLNFWLVPGDEEEPATNVSAPAPPSAGNQQRSSTAPSTGSADYGSVLPKRDATKQPPASADRSDETAAAMAKRKPSFDIVRVDPDGNTVIAGRAKPNAEVTILDGGTQGLYLVNYVEDADSLIVFDAIDYGLSPGELKLVRDDEVPRFTGAKKMSLHQTGFQEVLSAADLLGRYPKRLALIGCQPLDLEDWGGPLTAPVRAQIDPAIRLACDLLAQWGAPVAVRSAPLAPAERLLANDIDHLNYELRARSA